MLDTVGDYERENVVNSSIEVPHCTLQCGDTYDLKLYECACASFIINLNKYEYGYYFVNTSVTILTLILNYLIFFICTLLYMSSLLAQYKLYIFALYCLYASGPKFILYSYFNL